MFFFLHCCSSDLALRMNSITKNCWISHNTCYILLIFAITCSKISNIIFFTYMTFFTWYLSLFHQWSELHFVLSNLHLFPHDICLINTFELFIPVIMLNMFRFKSSVLFGTHALLGKSLIVLQIPRHLSNLILNG